MKLFLDSGDIDEIKEAFSWGGLDGVTSNPKLIASNWNGDNLAFLKALSILQRQQPVIVTLSSHERKEMKKEAREIHKVYPNVIVKLYMTREDLEFMQELKELDIKVHISLIYSVNQAFLAAKAGADVISPFMGRTDDFGGDSAALLDQIVGMIHNYGFGSEVMAASIRTPFHATAALLSGADIITLPFSVLMKMFCHPATEAGIADFAKAAAN
jgi:transaldolase